MSLISYSQRLFTDLGFDRPKFLVGLQTSCVAFIALAIAWALRLEHPQWAAITTFVTLQPSRGQIMEKSSWRFIGTILGSCVGALIAMAAGGTLMIELSALSLWAALMVFAGSLQRSYRSYGTVLAGYSAVIVIVLSPYDAATVQDVALDRILTVMIGAVSGVLWAYMMRVQNSHDEYSLKARRLMADMLVLAGQAQQDLTRRDEALFARLITAAAMLQDDLHTLTATARSSAPRRIEPLLQALTGLLFAAFQQPVSAALGRELETIGQQLHTQHDYSGLPQRLRKVIALCDAPGLEDSLTTLMARVSYLQTDVPALQIDLPSRNRYALDWAGATQGAIRIFVVLGLISLGWVLTGNSAFQYAMVSAAIAMALTTTGVTPTRKMIDVLKGQVLAALLALFVAGLLWPLFPGPLGQLACLALPALSFAFIRAHRRTSLSAADFSITVFLLLSPQYHGFVPGLPLLPAFMAVAGGGLGFLAFYLIFPTDARVRRKALWRMIKQDLQEIAQSNRVTLSFEGWRQSFATRFLKIAHWAALEGGRYERAAVTMHKGFVTMRLAEAVFALKRLEHRANLPPRLRSHLALNLARIAQASKESDNFLRALSRLAALLHQEGHPQEAQLLEAAVEDMRKLQGLRRS